MSCLAFSLIFGFSLPFGYTRYGTDYVPKPADGLFQIAVLGTLAAGINFKVVLPDVKNLWFLTHIVLFAYLALLTVDVPIPQQPSGFEWLGVLAFALAATVTIAQNLIVVLFGPIYLRAVTGCVSVVALLLFGLLFLVKRPARAKFQKIAQSMDSFIVRSSNS